jgi:DNA polymerase
MALPFDDPTEDMPRIGSMEALRETEAACPRCPLYKHATQVVPGEGPAHAKMMMIGERPGDQEDLVGRPFVGPAGRVLDKTIADAGTDRQEVFVSNAVNHFKFERRGKRRLHKRASAYEIERCRVWYDLELSLVGPDVVVALGASAARSVIGRAAAIAKMRGAARRRHARRRDNSSVLAAADGKRGPEASRICTLCQRSQAGRAERQALERGGGTCNNLKCLRVAGAALGRPGAKSRERVRMPMPRRPVREGYFEPLPVGGPHRPRRDNAIDPMDALRASARGRPVGPGKER